MPSGSYSANDRDSDQWCRAWPFTSSLLTGSLLQAAYVYDSKYSGRPEMRAYQLPRAETRLLASHLIPSRLKLLTFHAVPARCPDANKGCPFSPELSGVR